MIGFQTDPTYENWNGWPYIEVCFAARLAERLREVISESASRAEAILLILECFVRYWLTGVKCLGCLGS